MPIACDKPASGLRLLRNVAAVNVVAILIPLGRFDKGLAIAANEIQEGIGVSVVILIGFHTSLFSTTAELATANTNRMPQAFLPNKLT
ncbi:hypothetical protein SDC9_174830 [bioreactor metagenome]|uniref:Uncharacterized protein n=1 Tax=bioreactor metagenome TaxID=1076179 RepID=A0A645GKE3_9ZZZZ